VKMESSDSEINIIILDACRNNPRFGGSKGIGETGLAPMTGPKGTFMAYVTAPGTEAFMGDGKESIFTKHLIKAMKMRGLKIEDMFNGYESLYISRRYPTVWKPHESWRYCIVLFISFPRFAWECSPDASRPERRIFIMTKGMILILSFFLFIPCKAAYSQPCDPDISPVASPAVAYAPRGNRCEGFYRSQVAAKNIDVVGLTRGKFDFKWKKNEIIELSSPFVKSKPVHVRAVGIPVKTYYRMDSQIAPGKKLKWPIEDVIFPKKLYARKIGVFGWTGSEDEKLYVPLAKTGAENGNTNLYLRTSVDVDGVKWRYAHVIGGKCAPFGEWQDAPKKRYRSGKPVHIVLPPGKGDMLDVEVAAMEKGTASWRLKRQIRVTLKEASK